MAHKKASNAAVAPNNCAVTISRKKPKMRETSVMPATVDVDLKRLLLMQSATELKVPYPNTFQFKSEPCHTTA